MILVPFFSENNVLSDEIKICYIFECQSNENREFRFYGTPGINLDIRKKCNDLTSRQQAAWHVAARILLSHGPPPPPGGAACDSRYLASSAPLCSTISESPQSYKVQEHERK